MSEISGFVLPSPGTVTYRDGIAILQLIFFSGYLASAVLLIRKHEWTREAEFLIFVTFSTLRIVGACFQLASISHGTRTIYGGALTCEAIGVAPLTMVNVETDGSVRKKIHRIFFASFSASTIAGITIASYGGSLSAQAAVPFIPNSYVKAAAILFTVQYSFVGLIFFTTYAQMKDIPKPERRLLLCTAACSPFIIIRLVYTLLADFSGNLRFNILVGDTTTYLFMSVLSEIVAVGICIATGFTLPKLVKPPSVVAASVANTVEKPNSIGPESSEPNSETSTGGAQNI